MTSTSACGRRSFPPRHARADARRRWSDDGLERPSGPHATHFFVLGSFEAVAAVRFLVPQTLRFGSAGLLLSCGTAFIAHAAMSQWRGDLLVFMVAVLFVVIHGPAYRAAPGGASAA